MESRPTPDSVEDPSSIGVPHVGVAGFRNKSNVDTVFRALDSWCRRFETSQALHVGNANGVNTLARDRASSRKVFFVKHEAD